METKTKLIIIFLIIFIIILAFGPLLKKNARKLHAYIWFQHDANKENVPFNNLSGWRVSDKIFNETIEDWMHKMTPKIKSGDSIFEMGCGVGAVLKYINNNIENLTISGSDFSLNAIKKIKTIFPNGTFLCQNMTKNHHIPSNSQDHVISSGALGMYLYKNEMIIAIKEAVRMTKPGGSLCFTHFIEPNGKGRRSIFEKVNKSYWNEKSNDLGITNIKFFTLKHQDDRYGFVCNKK